MTTRYTALAGMLPVTVRRSAADADEVIVEQAGGHPDDEDHDCAVTIHRTQVKAVIQGLKAYLKDTA